MGVIQRAPDLNCCRLRRSQNESPSISLPGVVSRFMISPPSASLFRCTCSANFLSHEESRFRKLLDLDTLRPRWSSQSCLLRLSNSPRMGNETFFASGKERSQSCGSNDSTARGWFCPWQWAWSLERYFAAALYANLLLRLSRILKKIKFSP